MAENEPNFDTPARISRRKLLPGAALLAATGLRESSAAAEEPAAAWQPPEPYIVPQGEFGDVSRGNPVPHRLPEDRKQAVGLTRDTWRLEVLSDPQNPATLGRQFRKSDGTALDFAALLKLGEKHAVRFPKIITCLNLDRPLGMGIWEGVPLREVVWLTAPRENLRRVIYYGYHNDDPNQLFQGTLPISRVLEDPFDLPPVILCYKLNGEWLDPRRGGPVRVVVPEAYGFKNVKWITHVVLTNLSAASDTYALQNNDIDSPLKTFAAVASVPEPARPGTSIPVWGYAQVGMGGLARVQVWVQPKGEAWPADDPHFARAPWRDATILPPPADWGRGIPGGAVPQGVHGFDHATRRPKTWPMRFCKAYWSATLPPLRAGEYVVRCRSIDEKGQAQPMPRPFLKSGHCDILPVPLVVKG